MQWLAFILFSLATSYSIWNGQDHFDKKAWLIFGIKWLLAIIGPILGFILLLKILIYYSLPVDWLIPWSSMLMLSLFVLLGLKFMIVLIGLQFDLQLGFHRHVNSTDNYHKVSHLLKNYGPPLLLAIKAILSLNAICILYAIWFKLTF